MPRLNKGSQWNRFFAFIEYDLGSELVPRATALRALESDLGECGARVKEMKEAVDRFLDEARARTVRQPEWLSRAREAQREFESKLEHKRRDWVSGRFKSAREMLDAISSGALGAGVRDQALVFFRNRELGEASEADLREFLDDCEMLGLLDPIGNP